MCLFLLRAYLFVPRRDWARYKFRYKGTYQWYVCMCAIRRAYFLISHSENNFIPNTVPKTTLTHTDRIRFLVLLREVLRNKKRLNRAGRRPPSPIIHLRLQYLIQFILHHVLLLLLRCFFLLLLLSFCSVVLLLLLSTVTNPIQ